MALGIAYEPNTLWDVELTVASQTHISPYTRFVYSPESGGFGPRSFFAVTEFHRYRVMPVDLSATRHFLASRVIAPYVRAGVRYVNAPNNHSAYAELFGTPSGSIPGAIPVTEGFRLHDRASFQAGAGVRVRLTERTSLRVEMNRLLRSEDIGFDPLTRLALGASWKF